MVILTRYVEKVNKNVSRWGVPACFSKLEGLKMNKTVISFAEKYNLKYTEMQYMYSLTGYVFDFVALHPEYKEAFNSIYN